jgi:hypothetical protein
MINNMKYPSLHFENARFIKVEVNAMPRGGVGKPSKNSRRKSGPRRGDICPSRKGDFCFLVESQ